MIRLIGQLRRILLPGEKYRMLLTACLLFVGALLELAGVGAVLPVIAVFVNPGLARENEILNRIYIFFGEPEPAVFMIQLCLCTIFCFLGKNLFLFLINTFQIRFSYRVTGRLTNTLIEKYLGAPLEFHTDRGSAEILELVSQSRAVLSEFLTSLMMLLSETLVILTAFGVLLVFAPGTALGLTAAIGIFSWILYLALKRLLAHAAARVFGLETGLNRFILKSMSCIREIKVSDRMPEFRREGTMLQNEVVRNEGTLFALQQLPRFLIEAGIVTAGVGLVAVLTGCGIAPDRIALETSFIGLVLVRLMPSFSRLQYYFARIRGKLDLFEHIRSDLEHVFPESVPDEGQGRFELKKELRIEHLSFAHGGKRIFSDLNLTVPAKTSLALSGPTGCGKSTLLDLIAGLRKPESGRISADGTDISAMPGRWRAGVGCVPQTIFIADGTVLENVALGVPKEKIDRSRAAECLGIAQALEFVAALPGGMDAVLGEAGSRLSGGQRQRIGIARALYPDPDVLLFDEATSALDAETEAAFVEALSSLSGKYTMIIAAHRPSTIEGCTAIYRFPECNFAK